MQHRAEAGQRPGGDHDLVRVGGQAAGSEPVRDPLPQVLRAEGFVPGAVEGSGQPLHGLLDHRAGARGRQPGGRGQVDGRPVRAGDEGERGDARPSGNPDDCAGSLACAGPAARDEFGVGARDGRATQTQSERERTLTRQLRADRQVAFHDEPADGVGKAGVGCRVLRQRQEGLQAGDRAGLGDGHQSTVSQMAFSLKATSAARWTPCETCFRPATVSHGA